MLSVGAEFAGGLSMSFDPPPDWKVSPSVFSYHAGVDATYPLTPIVGASLGLGLDSRGTKYAWFDDKNMWEIRRVNYFTITPAVQLSAFYVGLNIGFPVGGSRTWQNYSGERERSQELDSKDDSLLTMIEPRIGAVIPLLEEEIGWLGLSVTAGYNLSEMSEKGDFLPAPSVTEQSATQAVSLHLGLTWQFGIPGTERNKKQ